MSRYYPWLIIILIALALRLYNLTYHSLWFDEAISIYWAQQSVPRILEVGFTLVEDRLPPLYYLMLKGWGNIFGFGEASVRGLSVIFGVLLVPVTAASGLSLFNKRVALIAATLVAFNPFLIWYSQEARMYAPAVFWGTLSIWAFLQICESANLRIVNDKRLANTKLKNRTPPLALSIFLFILSATAGLYSHLYSGFLLPGLGLWLIISYPRRWQLWLIFVTCGLIITLAYAPILSAIWRFSAEANPGNPFTGLAQRAGWLLQSFTIWKAPLSPTLQVTVPAVILLFTALAYLPINNYSLTTNKSTINKISSPAPQISNPTSHIPNPLLLITLLLACPFVIANMLLLRNHLAFFGERYFIVMVPWLLILAAAGADKLGGLIHRQIWKWRKSGSTQYAIRNTQHASRFTLPSSLLTLLPLLLLLILTALPLPGQWSVSAAKEAWRQSVNYLAQQATPKDGILIHPDWVRYPFQYYFQGPGQTYAAFSNVTATTALDGPLQGVVSHHHPVIWLIQSHIDSPDPERRVERWLASRYPLVTELYPPGIIIKGYAPGYQLNTLPPEATPADIQLANGMRLVGYQADKVASATDRLFHPPSGWVHVTLYWVADRPITSDARPMVQLVGPAGVWGASLERANDALGIYPPWRWAVGRPIIRHDLDVNLNPATPPGLYQLMVGLNDHQTAYLLTQVEIR